FCTSVAIMERGRVVVAGKIDEINARILGDTVLLVEVLGDESAEALLQIVTGDPRASAIQQRGRSFEFRFQGDVEQASDLLATLVRGGVRVASFAPRKENLEHLFLKVGAKELS